MLVLAGINQNQKDHQILSYVSLTNVAKDLWYYYSIQLSFYRANKKLFCNQCHLFHYIPVESASILSSWLSLEYESMM
jgi:hypothetical protein